MKFPLGRTVSTPGALKALEASGQTPSEFLARHGKGDWGEVSRDDAAENELSVGKNLRILSAYTLKNADRIWVITEADRTSTCILLPDEY